MVELNLTAVSQDETARTCIECARQRAKHLHMRQVQNVIELCAGPSLKTLERAYSEFGISVTGNDIDIRWKHYYLGGKWIIDNALNIDYNSYDAVVFAPPVSKGCTGKRDDALMISKVVPRYTDFIEKIIKDKYKGVAVLVLPARSWGTKQDREQYFKLTNYIFRAGFLYEAVALNNKKNIRNYIDMYLQSLSVEKT